MSIENKISPNIRMNRLLPIYDNKDLGITSIKTKLRVGYKNINKFHKNTTYNDLLKTLSINLLNDKTDKQKSDIFYGSLAYDYNLKAKEHNNQLEAQRKEKRAEAAKKKRTVKKSLKKITTFYSNVKFNLKPAEKSFKMYSKYTIPEYQFKKYRDIDPDSFLIPPLSLKTFTNALNHAYQFLYPIIKKNLQSFKVIRTFVKIEFKCLNTDPNMEEGTGLFIASRDLGRIDTSNIHEFRNYFYANAEKQFKELSEISYVEIQRVGKIEINVLKYNPLVGSSYTELPEFIKNTKSIINIKNTDNKCFIWACLASRKNVTKNAERVKQYEPFLNEFKYDEKDMPMTINKISKFEKENNVNVNVYMLENEASLVKLPIHISKQKNTELINLFLHDGHYSWIKTFSRFCGGSQEYNCPRCLKGYKNTQCYKNHIEMCQDLNENGSATIMPPRGTFTKFNDYRKQKRVPVVMYADFESSLMPLIVNNKEYIKSVHTANSFRLRIVSDVDLGMPLDYSYVGNNTDIEFVKLIVKLDNKITFKLRELSELNYKPNLTAKETFDFNNAVECSLCGVELKADRVRDHCHFTGKYSGACHNVCNIKATQLIKGNMTLPLFFHNSNYDIKCFINAFRELKGEDYIKSISGIPCNMEIFKALNINNICIMDSYAHLSSSLGNLISNLPDNKKIYIKEITDDPLKFKLINKKGFYPYEFVDNVDKLNTPITEIKREHFNSKLTLSKLTDEEWEHIQLVIKTFDIKTLREYHDIYLKIDVFGLCDVFEYYRELSFNLYGLDPAHYIGLPSYTWASGLKFTKAKLENLYDIDMYMLFEKMKRGGVSVISHRHAKANNQYLPDYDETKDTTFIQQFDCNNLYGWSMCENLPIDGFKWIPYFDETLISQYKSTDETGYVLEVDLEYPEHLHDEHNDYPLAPEHMVINGHKKLAPNLNDKEKYILHIDNLQYYLNMGMKLKKIYRAVCFRQSAWLKPYIDNNSKLRQLAKNDFEKDYYKLLNNAFYGKTMENVRDRVNIQFCLNEKSFLKHTSSPLFANNINVLKTDGLALVKTHKRSVELNKPLYIGACILESSKLLMFKFHYQTMKVKYPDALMMKTDTDSLCYLIKTDDLYDDFKNDPTLQKQIEFSNYPTNHPLYNNNRKKQVGIFQDESVSGKMVIIREYVGLRAKCYANELYVIEEDKYICKKKAKGVPTRHTDKRIDMDDYRNCQANQVKITLGDKNATRPEHREPITSFRSLKLKTYTIEQSKVALSGDDDKRYILPDNTHTLALGHYSIPKN